VFDKAMNQPNAPTHDPPPRGRGWSDRAREPQAISIDPARGHRVHQARLAQLAREASRTTAQHIAGYERQRRHAILVAITLDLSASLTDQAGGNLRVAGRRRQVAMAEQHLNYADVGAGFEQMGWPSCGRAYGR
jgi:hypothetical protein